MDVGMGHVAKYIQKELRELSLAKNVDLLVAPVEDDQGNAQLNHLRAVIMGSPDTPYGFGMFHFDITVPNDYPQRPPRVVITTTNQGLTRFNPNLYADGKVCLSILGTWEGESGEQWSAVHNIQAVLRSIQSLMHTHPYRNEPGYDKEGDEPTHKKYNDKIKHETIRVAVCGVIENILDGRDYSYMDDSWAFRYALKGWFLFNYDLYVDIIRKAMLDPDCADGTKFWRAPFEGKGNQMDGSFNYTKLLRQLNGIQDRLRAEEKAWADEGTALTSRRTSAALDLIHEWDSLQETTLDGISVSCEPENVFVWNASIFDDIGHYEGGCFPVRLVFSNNYPAEPPRVRFQYPVFHPHVTETDDRPRLGVYVPPEQRPLNVKRILLEIQAMLRDPPVPDPMLLVNPTAARLCFSNNEEDKREYRRRIQRCVQASQEL
eukprot:comp18104_c0_seq1/m.18756 comp18104_c0_seq1/g.18756  ORF comp18104_c0_seq1/g.18756 comp18104_c0_seq1/m.18756 type:complete len:432 (-) comp18104_c0_seq1:522-1817(-)